MAPGFPRDRLDFGLRARLRHALKRGRVKDGAGIVVAVSGGADSTALLRLLAFDAPRRSLRLVVAHLDHGVRPGSAEDAARVAALAGELGLPFRAAALTRGATRWPPGEQALRILRRRWLREVAREVGASRVALGHTRDDQAETVLLHLLRGCGIGGLSGMSDRQGIWLRPLLRIGRMELRDFLQRHGQRWHDDPTNEDTRFLRNRVRHRLLPLLEREFDPATTRILARNADALRAIHRHVEREVSRAWASLVRQEDVGVIRLERPGLASYDRALLEGCLRRAYRQLAGTTRDLKQIHLERLTDAVQRGGRARFELPRRIRVDVGRSTICFARRPEARD